MFGLWKSKKRRQEEEVEVAEKNDLKAIMTEDLLGASDWKESKVGYLTGLSTVGRIAGNFATNLSQSFGRTALMFRLMTATDTLPSLPEVSPEQFDGRRRFEEAMQLHRRNEGQVVASIANTYRNSLFYLALTLAAVLWLLVDLAVKKEMAITTLALHLAPIPICGAWAFKSMFVNWMFRNRCLASPAAFIRSGDWMPKK